MFKCRSRVHFNAMINGFHFIKTRRYDSMNFEEFLTKKIYHYTYKIYKSSIHEIDLSNSSKIIHTKVTNIIYRVMKKFMSAESNFMINFKKQKYSDNFIRFSFWIHSILSLK